MVITIDTRSTVVWCSIASFARFYTSNALSLIIVFHKSPSLVTTNADLVTLTSSTVRTTVLTNSFIVRIVSFITPHTFVGVHTIALDTVIDDWTKFTNLTSTNTDQVIA